MNAASETDSFAEEGVDAEDDGWVFLGVPESFLKASSCADDLSTDELRSSVDSLGAT